jgi:hypothetical protein
MEVIVARWPCFPAWLGPGQYIPSGPEAPSDGKIHEVLDRAGVATVESQSVALVNLVGFKPRRCASRYSTN